MASPQVLWNGTVIADIGKATFSGSAKPIVNAMPQTTGALIIPGDSPERKISLECFFELGNHNKDQIEKLHHSLIKLISKSCAQGVGQLTANGNLYSDVSVTNINFSNITHNRYFIFTIEAILDHDMGYFESQIQTNQTRNGNFVFDFRQLDGTVNQATFPILHNYEASTTIKYSTNSKPRKFNRYGMENKYEGGVGEISLECWLQNNTVQNIESYMANYLIGPLGKRGTLNISNKVIENCILTNVTNSEHITSSMEYGVKFLIPTC